MIRFPWAIVLLLALIAVFFGLRLGYKTASLTETDIINHYVGAFLDTMQSSGLVVDSGFCHAEPGVRRWERLRVVCRTPSGAIYIYSIGHWGQLLGGRPELIVGAT